MTGGSCDEIELKITEFHVPSLVACYFQNEAGWCGAGTKKVM